MRIAVVVALAALAFSGAAAAAIAPPVIHETFTLLPCPKHPATTIALEGCSEHAILKTDRAIDAEAKTVFRLLAPSARGAFVRGERSWLAYRRSFCTAEASKYAGGTAEPVLFGSCEIARNRTHLRDLAELRRTLAQH